MKSIYVIGSLRNKRIPEVARSIRKRLGIEAFDQWYAAGEKADDAWQEYSDFKGLTYKEALQDHNAKHVFAFDKTHLDRVDGAVLVMPAGRSGHLELGYVCGSGKPTFVLFDAIPERYDVMYQFCTDVCFSEDELIDSIKKYGNSV